MEVPALADSPIACRCCGVSDAMTVAAGGSWGLRGPMAMKAWCQELESMKFDGMTLICIAISVHAGGVVI